MAKVSRSLMEWVMLAAFPLLTLAYLFGRGVYTQRKYIKKRGLLMKKPSKHTGNIYYANVIESRLTALHLAICLLILVIGLYGLWTIKWSI